MTHPKITLFTDSVGAAETDSNHYLPPKERLFNIPEIISHIFHILAEEALYFSDLSRRYGLWEPCALRIRQCRPPYIANPTLSVLNACVRVCHGWFRLGIEHLWRLSIPWVRRMDIERILEDIESEERRALYAALTTEASIRLFPPESLFWGNPYEGRPVLDSWNWHDEEYAPDVRNRPHRPHTDPVFKGLAFPRLRRVFLDLDNCNDNNPELAPQKLLTLAPWAQEGTGSGGGGGLGHGGWAGSRGNTEAGSPGGRAGHEERAGDPTDTDEQEPLECAVFEDQDEPFDLVARVTLATQPETPAQRRRRLKQRVMRRLSRVSHDTRLALPVAELDERHPGAKNVEELVVRVKIIDCSPTLYPNEEAMERLADVIPVVFPNLRYVYFQRETRLSDEALQRLSDRLKKMEYLSIAQFEEARTRRHN